MGDEPEVLADVDSDNQGPNIEHAAPNAGSAGHDWGLCRRPCIYYAASGNCSKGSGCNLANSIPGVVMLTFRLSMPVHLFDKLKQHWHDKQHVYWHERLGVNMNERYWTKFST